MKSIKRLVGPFMILLLGSHLIAQEKDEVNIGIIVDGSWGENRVRLQTIRNEILALTTGEFNVQFPDAKVIESNWRIDEIRLAIDKLLADNEIDIVLTLGTISSLEVCQRQSLPKPVIAPFVLDADLQKLPVKQGRSGVKNLNFVTVPSTIESDIQIFQDIVSFNKVAVLVNECYLNAFPGFHNDAKEYFHKINLDVQLIGVKNDISAAIGKITPEIEAVYILPLLHLSDSQYEQLAQALVERKLPSFAFSGAERVEQGILAGLNKDVLNRLARRIAINVQRILLGDAPESIPVAISLRKQLTINDATSQAIQVFPSWAVVTEADLVGRQPDPVQRKLDFKSVVQDALAANLELAAKVLYVEAGRKQLQEAWSKLFPSIDLSSTYLIIDKDRAEMSMGQQPERTLSGSVTATQILFSEPALANLSIQKKIQQTKEFEYDQLQLDIIQQAATGYLNVLRAKTYERIQHENLRLTRQNLELARVRQAIGSSGPSEVYRWESQIALNRNSVIEANAQRNLAEIQVNRLLHRPAEESFQTLEADINDPVLITFHEVIFQYIENRQAFKLFRKFMVDEGMGNSPELAALDAAIGAQERALRSATNAFWAPTLAFQASVDNKFSKEGAGLTPPPGFSTPKDLTWNIGFNLSFPLVQGGNKILVRQRVMKELAQLRTERQMVAEMIEQRIRSSLHIAGASYASIRQTRLAAEAANKSLDVVQDLYSQGLVSIVELLDVQNSALVTDLAAANAVYDFLVDLFEVERSIGASDFLATEEDHNAFLLRAEQYFEKAGFRMN